MIWSRSWKMPCLRYHSMSLAAPSPRKAVETTRSLQSTIVQVNVPGNTYQVHQDVLIRRSGYFKGRLNPGFLKPGTTVELYWRPEFPFSDGFGSVMEFMYVGEFRRRGGQTRQSEAKRAAYVYVLADYLQMKELRDQALARFGEELLGAPAQYDTWGLRVEPSTSRVALCPSVVVELKRLLYENAFDTDEATDLEVSSMHAPSNETSETKELDKDPEPQETDSQDIVSTADVPTSAAYDDPRTPARRVFVDCIAADLGRLLHTELCRELFSGGGDFVLDILAFKATAL